MGFVSRGVVDRAFIGAINYYRDMWPRRPHILSPLTDTTEKYADKTKKVKFEWTPAMNKAFNKMKVLLAYATMTLCPDHNKPFIIYTDASDYQMGGFIMQEYNGIWRPVAYYNKNLIVLKETIQQLKKSY